MEHYPRRGELEVRDVSGPEFLRLLANSSRSDATGSRISSQFEKQLRNGEPNYGAFGLFACGQLVGGLSYGIIELRREEKLSARLDTVVTPQHVRGMGLGGFLMNEFVCRLSEKYGPDLVHFSTVAVHPAVARCVSEIGFTCVDASDTPLYHVRVSEDEREDLLHRADNQRKKRLSQIRAECVRCQFTRGTVPWCAR